MGLLYFTRQLAMTVNVLSQLLILISDGPSHVSISGPGWIFWKQKKKYLDIYDNRFSWTFLGPSRPNNKCKFSVFLFSCIQFRSSHDRITRILTSDWPKYSSPKSGEKAGLAGQTIQLLCVLDCHPPPSITWYRLRDSSQVSPSPCTSIVASKNHVNLSTKKFRKLKHLADVSETGCTTCLE